MPVVHGSTFHKQYLFHENSLNSVFKQNYDVDYLRTRIWLTFKLAHFSKELIIQLHDVCFLPNQEWMNEGNLFTAINVEICLLNLQQFHWCTSPVQISTITEVHQRTPIFQGNINRIVEYLFPFLPFVLLILFPSIFIFNIIGSCHCSSIPTTTLRKEVKTK